ncbi:hypothetical protein LTR70_009884 [Exophiala xenobiotica]|uniref:Nitronate monooxygenase domain-containing protein n=1 Tax=Lithohypha guttulata TaxID=1690604 RepID=A0ABR0JVZ8_9EURO|nr:hypothetical protein LTR24_009775 [Lithohypha guttulata]KAK5309923.1 hypothetical protein LTR70_009884 [Exophiala xenobiotica]
MSPLNEQFPWTTSPVVVGAPMRIIALPPVAVEISAAGGFGFIGAGNNLDELEGWLEQAAKLISNHTKLQAYHEKTGMLPVGFAYFNWAPEADLEKAMAAVKKWKPAAVWQFGAHKNEDYATWAEKIRQAGEGRTKVWVQVGSVADAVEVAKNAKPDVLVVQGTDAGGHGLESGASLITLLPEVADALQAAGLTSIKLVAAGGIIEGRGAAAALTLGADGVCLGTRFLASVEATVADPYRKEVIRASDGGANTARTKLYDQLRGTTQWPAHYNGRGILNQSFHDSLSGMSIEDNKKLYEEAMKQGDAGWGVNGRVTAYAGTGVGLVKSVMKAGDIVHSTKSEAYNMGHNDMIILHGVSTSNGREQPLAIMVDTGCSTSCMPRQSIRRLGLPTRRLKHPMRARIADGSTYAITLEAKLTFRIGSYQCTLWVHESAGTLGDQDMLLDMEWMTRENPKICFNPLSIKVRGHELTVRSAPRNYCDAHGYNCPEKGSGRAFGGDGARPPAPGRGRSRDDMLRDLLGNLRSGGGYEGGYGGWGGRGFGTQPIPVFKHMETTHDYLPCELDTGARKQREEAWIDWRDLFPDRTWYDPDSKVQTQGSMAFVPPSTKAKRNLEKSSHSDTKDKVIEWLQKHVHEPGSINHDKESSSRNDASDHASRVHQVKLPSERGPSKTPAKKARAESKADGILDKSQSLSGALQCVWLDKKITNPTTALKNDTRRLLADDGFQKETRDL